MLRKLALVAAVTLATLTTASACPRDEVRCSNPDGAVGDIRTTDTANKFRVCGTNGNWYTETNPNTPGPIKAETDD